MQYQRLEETESLSAVQEISRLFLSPTVHYCVHKTLLLGPTLSQFTPTLLNPFPGGFRIQIMYVFQVPFKRSNVPPISSLI
jgi:hypothetical protein